MRVRRACPSESKRLLVCGSILYILLLSGFFMCHLGCGGTCFCLYLSLRLASKNCQEPVPCIWVCRVGKMSGMVLDATYYMERWKYHTSRKVARV